MAFNVLLFINFLFFWIPSNDVVPKSIYDFKVTARDGSTIDFSQYRGKKILIVNTPIENDYKAQYRELDALYQKYKGKLVVIGFLADDFEIRPGSKKSPANVEKHYNVTFPLAAHVLVRTDDMAPIFKWLTEKQYNNYEDNEVKWDFQKYLINEKGELVQIFDPTIRPNDPSIVAAIEK